MYEPDALQVPRLCEELTQGLTEGAEQPSYVRAAMAHLNLVMIHPFRDGDGRMARCLQTLLLARDSIVAPSSSGVQPVPPRAMQHRSVPRACSSSNSNRSGVPVGIRFARNADASGPRHRTGCFGSLVSGVSMFSLDPRTDPV